MDYYDLRKEMVKFQIAQRGIDKAEILEAMCNVPRHLFVPEDKLECAHQDHSVSIGCDQTISQPFIVALMTKAAQISQGCKVLEIGTGSGYQAAILAYLGAKVYSVERIAELAAKAKKLLVSLGYEIEISIGDGSLGLSQHAPYQRIIVTAAAPDISKEWLNQLDLGGKIIVPLGDRLTQDLVVITKESAENVTKEIICSCRFVPLIGKKGFND